MPEYDVPGLPDVCWPVDTSCIEDYDAWATEPDPDNDVAGVPVYSAAQKARSLAWAATTLRMLTGYRVGGCPTTVRPCSRRVLRRHTWLEPSYAATFSPVLVSGQWLNIGCGHTAACSCSSLAQVRLPASYTDVTEVKVDGVVIDPAAYRLDRGGYLVRVDGGRWPLTQDLTRNDDQPGTWSVTVQSGVPVDALGAYAAGVLAGEFLNACSGSDCRLPSGVTQIVRQGVTITLPGEAFPGGLTGIREVDAWIRRYNPNGLKAPPMVYSPDVARVRAEARRNAYVGPSDDIDGGSP